MLTAPTCPFAAVEHTKFKHLGYTGVYNILDYSCVSFPCNVTVDQAVDVHVTKEAPLSEVDALVQQECKLPRFSLKCVQGGVKKKEKKKAILTSMFHR